MDATGRGRMSKIKLARTLREPAGLVAPRPCTCGCSPRSGKGRGTLCGGGDARHGRADRPPMIPMIRSRVSSFRAPRNWSLNETRMPIQSAITRIRRSPASCIAIPIGCYSSWFTSARYIADFVFAAKWSGRARRPALSPAAYDSALDYIRAHPEVWEVILTGGDPLMLSPRRLGDIMADLAAIDHVKIIRIHTRVPVADPARITGEMVAALRAEGATTWVALHANHARELTDKARAACADIIDAGIPMVSQSVLLRGVNDNAAALEALMRAFVECRIKPYYLHHGDLAPGTAHLRTTLKHGQELMRALRAGSPDCASRISSSTFPAATARPRSVRVICRTQILFPGNVNRPGKRAIVSSTIAATFISILRNHDRQMMDGGRSEPEPPENQGNRNIENAVMLGFFIVLVTAGIWVACYHGGHTKGSGLRRPGTPQLFDDRDSRPAAIRCISLGMGEARCESSSRQS